MALVTTDCDVLVFDQRQGPQASAADPSEGCAEGVAVGNGQLVVVAYDEDTFEYEVVVTPVP